MTSQEMFDFNDSFDEEEEQQGTVEEEEHQETASEHRERDVRSASPEVPLDDGRGTRSFYGRTPKRAIKSSAGSSTVPKVAARKNKLFSSRLMVERSKKGSESTSVSKAKSVASTGAKQTLPRNGVSTTQGSTTQVSTVTRQKGTTSKNLPQTVDEDIGNQLPRWCVELDDSDDLSKSSINSNVSEESDSEEEARSLPVGKTKKRRLNPYDDVKEGLNDLKNVLEKLCQKVESNEKCLKEIQSRKTSSVSSSDSSSCKTIPLIVRQEVRKVYRALLDDDEDQTFSGWCISEGSTIKSKENQVVIARLVKEVKGLNPTFNGADIRDAAYRFYKTKCEEESLRKSGKAETKKVTRRRHERVSRKRKERQAAIMKNKNLTEDQRKKWLTVITNEYMSSEESDDEAILVHPIPWRSDYVNRMFKKIDDYCNDKKSPQAKRQMKQRKAGRTSTRSKPGDDPPVWAVRK